MHFDTSVPIVHPVVEMKICYSKHICEERARLLAKGYGYATLLLVEHEKHSWHGGTREVFSAGTAFRFVNFTRPGKWLLTLMLIRCEPSAYSKFRSHDLEERLRDAMNRKNNPTTIPSIDSLCVWGDVEHREKYPDVSVYQQWPFYDDDKTALVAISQKEVEIPEEIFAPEPPQWLKDYAVYFVPGRSSDQCRFRQRYPLMIMQTPVWFVWEVFKRLVHGVISLVQTLDMRQGGIENLIASFYPAVKFEIMTPDRTRNDNDGHKGRVGPWSKRRGWIVTPLTAMTIAFLLYLVVKIAIPVLLLFVTWSTSSAGRPMVFIAPLTLFVAGIVLYKNKIVAAWTARSRAKKIERAKRSEERFNLARKEAAKLAADEAKRQSAYLVCGGVGQDSFTFAPLPTEVKTWTGRFAALKRAITLEPVPQEMRTTSLRFQAAKRVVCAPFKR
jgi:hypothetical protein